jgi:hypothetical protein
VSHDHLEGKHDGLAESIDVALPAIEANEGPTHGDILGSLESSAIRLHCSNFRAILVQCSDMYADALESAAQMFEQRLMTSGIYDGDTQRVLEHMKVLRKSCEDELSLRLFLPSPTEIV